MAVSKDFFLKIALNEGNMYSTVNIVEMFEPISWFHEEVISNGGKDKLGGTIIVFTASLRETYQKL